MCVGSSGVVSSSRDLFLLQMLAGGFSAFPGIRLLKLELFSYRVTAIGIHIVAEPLEQVPEEDDQAEASAVIVSYMY